jgi:hypothetical protein
MVLTGETEVLEGKTCPRAKENTTNLICNDLGWNPSLLGEI